MGKYGHGKSAWLPLLLFALLVSSANFLHTERTLRSSDTCPVCHFQNTTILTAGAIAVFLVVLISICFVATRRQVLTSLLLEIRLASRSPPAAGI
jgi:hypothetical protein